MIVEIERLLRDAHEALDAAGVRYAVIGGCARNAYAEPRATKDVDFVVEASTEAFFEVEQALSERGFRPASRVAAGGDPVPDLVLYRDGAGRRIDLLFAKTDFETSALDRCQKSRTQGVELPIVSVEDLVVYKLLSARTQDWADLEKVLRAVELRGGVLDWIYVERWCGEWEVLDRLARLRALSGQTD